MYVLDYKMDIKDKLVYVPQFALKWPRVGPGALQPCHFAVTSSKTFNLVNLVNLINFT